MTQKSQVFTSSGTWTRPAGVEWVYFWAVGGGAGGENETGTDYSYGGGGGAVMHGLIPANSDLTVTIGAGGAGGASGGSNYGADGGDSRIENSANELLVVAPGGKTPPFDSEKPYDMDNISGPWSMSRELSASWWASPGAEGGDANGGGGGFGFGPDGHGKGGDGSGDAGVRASDGGTGAGGGSSTNDGGGGDGGQGLVILMWSE